MTRGDVLVVACASLLGGALGALWFTVLSPLVALLVTALSAATVGLGSRLLLPPPPPRRPDPPTEDAPTEDAP